MRNPIYRVLEAGVLLPALLVLGFKNEAHAQIDIHINISPPAIMVAEPPAMVMIPNSTIYFVPQVEIDILFFDNYWWAPRGDQWYRSSAYNGSWERIENHDVPDQVYKVPKDYRQRYDKEQHIPYGQWKKQWHEQGKKDRGERREDKRGKKQDKQNRGHGKKGDQADQ